MNCRANILQWPLKELMILILRRDISCKVFHITDLNNKTLEIAMRKFLFAFCVLRVYVEFAHNLCSTLLKSPKPGLHSKNLIGLLYNPTDRLIWGLGSP